MDERTAMVHRVIDTIMIHFETKSGGLSLEDRAAVREIVATRAAWMFRDIHTDVQHLLLARCDADQNVQH